MSRVNSRKPVFFVVAALVLTPCAGAQFFRGVNIAGAEFGMSKLPGTYNSEPTFRYFATWITAPAGAQTQEAVVVEHRTPGS